MTTKLKAFWLEYNSNFFLNLLTIWNNITVILYINLVYEEFNVKTRPMFLIKSNQKMAKT